jgi:hypothetical protein
MQQVLPARSSRLQVLLVVLCTLFEQCASDCTDETTTVYFAALLSQADQKSCNRAQLSFQVPSRSAALPLIHVAVQVYYWMELVQHATEWTQLHQDNHCVRPLVVQPWFIQQPRHAAAYELAWRRDSDHNKRPHEVHNGCHALGVSSVSSSVLYDQKALELMLVSRGLGLATMDQFIANTNGTLHEVATAPGMHGSCCRAGAVSHKCTGRLAHHEREFFGMPFKVVSLHCPEGGQWSSSNSPLPGNNPLHGSRQRHYAYGFYGMHSEKSTLRRLASLASR